VSRAFSVALVVAGLAFAGEGTDLYLTGLDALERGVWDEAVDYLGKAVEADDENPDYHLAHGVALAFAERVHAAARSLQRADRLRPNHDPTRLWHASVVAMKGEFREDQKIYPAATRDPYETAVREMSRWYGEPAFRANHLGDDDPSYQKSREKARGRFRTLARQFVKRQKPAGAAIAGALKDRGIARYRNKDYEGAYADLQRLNTPDDAEVLFCLAGCKLELGSPEGARADYTILLARDPLFGDAYVGRALAHVALGSTERARLDIALAKAHGADARRAEQRLRAMGEPVPAGAGATVLAELAAEARAGAGWDGLLDGATALVRTAHAARLRADETYQRRLRDLRAAVDAAPDDADRLADLGQFLYDEATTVLIEWVEPRAPRRPYRPQDQAGELEEAEKALDAALAIAPEHTKAMAFKAACLIRKRQWEPARKLLERALELAPTDAVVLGLVSQVLDHIAAIKAASAANLRSVKSWESWHYIYYRYPSKAELRLADAYERQARWLQGKARESLVKAVEAESGKSRGFFYSGELARWDGDVEAARAAYTKAVELDPRYRSAWLRLADVYRRLQRAEDAYRAQSAAANLSHTTAAAMLKLAWLQIARTAWRSAGAALDEAAGIDAADPRVAAYRGVVAELQGKHEDASAHYRVALAINEAAARFRGVFLRRSEAPIDPNDAALAMELAYRCGRLALRAGQARAAADVLAAYLPLHARVEEAARYADAWKAMLPGPGRSDGLIPGAPNVETLAAFGRVRFGDALVRLGRLDDAIRELTWVVEFESRQPSVLTAGELIHEPAQLATAHLARAALRKGDRALAERAFSGLGQSKRFSTDVAVEIEQIRQEVGRALHGGQRRPQTLTEKRRRMWMRQREQLVAAKRAQEEILASPSATEAQKRTARQSIAALEDEIRTLDERIARGR